ncbi:MAG: sugar phosphate isomerase/epimerase [Kangiellaceae bacterium]|nr:sugar phosphate isomerase/epimerase [Kangiellaceae bacterium]
MKGPAIFLAQFISQDKPFDQLESIARWASELGYKGIQLPTHTNQLIDLKLAAENIDYCQELQGTLAQHGIEISELSTHLQGQVLAVHPTYERMFEQFAPKALIGKSSAQIDWANDQLVLAAKASQNLGLDSHVTFSGSLLWPYFYPWPQRPKDLVEEGFKELAKRWLPVLDVFGECGVDVCFELHPGEDLHDGITFERFLTAVNNHERANILYDPSHLLLQHIDYLGFIECYRERIKAFHVKDAEYNYNAKSGVYGGYQTWLERAGRFRSLGDGQIDFKKIFSLFCQFDFKGWAVLEWECCLKNSQDGAEEGVRFITDHIIKKTTNAFDDFVAVESSESSNRNLLGLLN